MRVVHCFLKLAALAILLKNVYSDSSNNPLANDSTVESYTLAVHWPLGVCNGNSGIKCLINPVPTEFKIHGLWPVNTVASSERFDANKITGLTSELNRNWPNLKSKQQQISYNIIFWEHEWTTHGIYSELGVLGYFQKTLELFRNDGEGLKAKLGKKGITPSYSTTYKLEAIKAALRDINGGVSVTVVCNKRSTNKKETQIQEVRFKFTKDFQKQDNNVASTTCGTATTDVMFPLAII